MDPSSMFGPLDALSQQQWELVLLALVVVNFGTRFLAHKTHVSQYESGGSDAITRFLPHEVMNGVLVLGAAYYLTVEPHGGTVFATLVLGLVITDFFEFEARQVEARKEEVLDRPKGALVTATLALAYIGYQSVFYIIKPIWGAVV